MEDEKKCQVIICKCGAKFAACVEPYCYTEKDWQKDLRKYVNNGCKIEMMSAKNFKFERCTCKIDEVKNEVDPKQTELF